jgi:hypothetical protein
MNSGNYQHQNSQNERNLRDFLKQNLPRVANTELSRDLWPQMLEKLSRQSAAAPWHIRVPWFDWALGALAGAALLVFPGIIPALFYHF